MESCFITFLRQTAFLFQIEVAVFRFVVIFRADDAGGIQFFVGFVASFGVNQLTFGVHRLVHLHDGVLAGVVLRYLHLHQEVIDVGLLIHQTQFQVGIAQPEDWLTVRHHGAVFRKDFLHPSAFQEV